MEIENAANQRRSMLWLSGAGIFIAKYREFLKAIRPETSLAAHKYSHMRYNYVTRSVVT